ncbi:MAG: DNA topoisomerase IV [Micrococcales bacterium 73-13]|nr:MAG: DNA topoisomerase IV [Micrococcales bacterium 73-13]
MAPAAEQPGGERIEDVDVASEMQGSFLEYAYSVIHARALPDARDGLKPVQRRILFQMTEMGLRPDRGHVKSARVVGDVMGRLHPHGDSAIYDAMVRLAQDFAMRVPLVDGHGNFGSLDDGPAAARYTEARLTAAALAMTEGLDEDVVDFVPNYDNQFLQPAVLPAAFPNLLVNGASGIAVGMATNMAPHNLIEVVAAARHLLEHPDASVAELMRFVPGPDLPTGGSIVGLDGVREAYETGRGSFRMRAKVAIDSSGRRPSLVVTELPYLVGTEKVIERIKDGVSAKKIQGISDVADLTDRRHGLRLIIEVKTGFSPQAVLEQLYRATPLEESFSINNVALVDGGPRTLGLRELLRVYLDHRIEVVRRRSAHRLARRRERLHLVEGLLVAILDIDEVIQLIRSSDDAEEARARLMSVFDLSEAQAEYILELRLRRLTRFSRVELEAERDQLVAEIAELEAILAERSRLIALVGDELEETAERLGTPRRTVLSTAAPTAPARRAGDATVAALEVPDAPCEVVLSASGRMIRVNQADGLAIPRAARRGKHDAVRSRVATTARADVGAVTSAGRLIRFTAADLPSVPSTSALLSAGIRISGYLDLGRGEQVLGLVDLAAELPVALGTAQGVVKRVAPGAWPSRPDFEVIALKPGDAVVGVGQGPDSDELVFITAGAQLLRFSAALVRPQGVGAAGMAGIGLSGKDRVVFFGEVPPDDQAVVATVSTPDATLAGADPGRAKVSALAEFPAKGRATGGVRAHAFLKGESALALAWAGTGPALANGPGGEVRALPDPGAKRDASGTILDGVVGAIGGPL